MVPASRWPKVGVIGGRASILIAVLGSACATGLGPRAVRSERASYNEQIVRSADAELLLNLVRLRYNESLLFLELSSVVAQYGYDASLNAGGTFGGGNDTGTIGTALAYSEKPTVTYAPLAGEEFATRMLTPIPLESLMLFAQSGWSAERLLLVAVQQVNDVLNAPTAGGPTPGSSPSMSPSPSLPIAFTAWNPRASSASIGRGESTRRRRRDGNPASGYVRRPTAAAPSPVTSQRSVATSAWLPAGTTSPLLRFPSSASRRKSASAAGLCSVSCTSSPHRSSRRLQI